MLCPHCLKDTNEKPKEERKWEDPIKRMSRALKESARKIRAGDKVEIEKIRKLLVKAGIYTEKGNLRKPYR
jgi:hypothetical protein